MRCRDDGMIIIYDFLKSTNIDRHSSKSINLLSVFADKFIRCFILINFIFLKKIDEFFFYEQIILYSFNFKVSQSTLGHWCYCREFECTFSSLLLSCSSQNFRWSLFRFLCVFIILAIIWIVSSPIRRKGWKPSLIVSH